MRRFNTIIESANPPGRNQLWIDHKKLRYFAEEKWRLLGGNETPPTISDHETWIIEGVDTGKPTRGERGYTGPKGDNGITPSIGPNLNWFIGSDDTGVLARGTNGKDGRDGINGTNGTDGTNGIDGIDGEDGVSSRAAVIFISSLVKPSTPTGGSWNEQSNEITCPSGWRESIPQGELPVYMSTAVFQSTLPQNPIWSNPIRITGIKGIDGTDGSDGTDGNSTRTMYCKTSGPNNIPVVIKDNINPGSIWGTSIPNRTSSESIWGIQALVSPTNQLVNNWEGPYLLTGINGTNGENGKTPNWKTYVFKLSDSKPSGPTGDNPSNPGNGWVDYPNQEGNWWQCVGTVNGTTGKVVEWSEVIPLNGRDGQDGTAQDGKFTEFRFAKSSSDSAPSVVKSDRNPSGWTTSFPTISNTEILWMIKAVINPDNTLYSNWEGPIRISGEKGPQGNTGPAGKDGVNGSQGVAGIPGVDIELRFSLGTDITYDATWNDTVKTTRNPTSYGWSLQMPTPTDSKPYIWLIQARIAHQVNGDAGTLETGSWSTPIKLNGTNGLPGPQGKKGQVVYPAGVYGNTVSYTTTETKAPYVYDPSDGNFYVLNAIMTWKGSEQDNKTPSQSYAESQGSYWLRFDAYEAVYAKIGIIANGLIGSAVFNGDYMFSQQGTNASGAESSNYEDFGTSDFTPNFQVNFRTGEIQAKKGIISNGLTSQWTVLQMSKDYTSMKGQEYDHRTAVFDINPNNLATNNLLLVDNWSNVTNSDGTRWSIEVRLSRGVEYIGTMLNIKFVMLGIPSSITFDQVQYEITNAGSYTFTLGRKNYNAVTTFNEQAVTLLAEPYVAGNGTADPTVISRCIWRVISPGFKGGAGTINADPNI